jgi:hypothetical protein
VENAHSSTLGENVKFSYSDGHTPGLMLGEIVTPDGPSRPSMASGGRSEPSMASAAPGLLPSALGLLPGAGVVFCADLIPGRPWVHLPVTMGYDRAPELLIDEKRAFLEDKLARGVRLFFTHDTGCALARVTRDEKGRFGTADELPELIGWAV